MGAMMTVSMWRFISSGEMMRQGRVFLISRPSVGSRRGALQSERLPPPLCLVPFGWRQIQERIISVPFHLPKRLFPTRSRLGDGTDDQLIVLHFEFNGIRQLALLQERLGNTDATGIADANNTGFHEPNSLLLNGDY